MPTPRPRLARRSTRSGSGKKQKPGIKPPRFPKFGSSFTGNLISTILIFLLLMSLYTLFSSPGTKIQDIPLSQVAQDVSAGKVAAIKVSGDRLNLTYTDGTVRTSRKDPAAALAQTLTAYGVTPTELSKTAITIEGESGWYFWLTTLAPVLLSFLFFALLFWFLSRQVKGAG
ncbi:MAG: hypothetical protein B7W98_03145, partial [Parcubacteria group bacterium 20-58-5]